MAYDLESLVHFATESYELAEHQDRVPLIPTIWDELRYVWNQEVKMKGGIVNTLLMKDDEGTIYYSAILMVYGMPVITVVIFYYMMKSAFTGDDTIASQTEAIEAKNERTKARML